MKNYHYLLTCALSFLFYCAPKALAQAPDVVWQHTLGGSGTDIALNVQETPDGGYIVVGTEEKMSSSGPGVNASNVAVTKFSATGTVLWHKVYGGSYNEYGYAIRNTIDGGFIVAASSSSSDFDVATHLGGLDVWILKLSDTGAIEWQSVVGGAGSESAYDIRQTSDTGYVFVGNTSSSNGHLTGNWGGYDMWIAKLSKTGALQWQRNYGGTANDNLFSVLQTADGGYIVAGDTYSSDGNIITSRGNEDAWVAKLDTLGAIQWQNNYGGLNADYAQCIRATPDGRYIVAGGSNSNNGHVAGNIGGGDVWVFKITATGELIWQRCSGSTSDDAANSIELTHDGGFIISGWAGAGNTNVSGFVGLRDYWLLKLSATGYLEWQKCLNDDPFNEAHSAIQASNGNYVVAGRNASFGSGASNGWVVALSHSAGIKEEVDTPQPGIYPNPTTGMLFLNGASHATISVTNMLSATLLTAYDTDRIDLSLLPSGIYMVSITEQAGSLTRRLKVLKQ